MNWHKNSALKTAYKNRKLKSHVVDWSRYGNYAICGRRAFIYVNKIHIGNHKNNVCKDCLKLSGIIE